MNAPRVLLALLVLFYPGYRMAAAGKGSFTLLHSLVSDSGQVGAWFGYSVAIEGNIAVVGVAYDDLGATDAGMVKVYDVRSGALLHTITNPAPEFRDLFGSSVAISGRKVVVGAYMDNNGAPDGGGAYVYDLGNLDQPPVTLVNPTPGGDWFGISVAIAGSTVVVGAVWDGTGGPDSGSVYIYDLGSPTPGIAVLTIPNPSPNEQDYFGISVAVSGTRVVVGAESDDTADYDSGMVHVFDLASGTPSVPVLSLTHPSPAAGDEFGTAVAISGTMLVVGANRDDHGTEDAGAAYVYDLAGATPAAPMLMITNPTPAFVDYFAVHLAASGRRIVITADLDDTFGENAGIAYVYDVTSPTPALPIAILSSPHPAQGDVFGNSVGFDGINIIIGAAAMDTTATDAGSAFIFGLPIVRVVPGAPGFATVSWIPADLSDFTLQFADSVVSTNWVSFPSGTSNPVTVGTSEASRFFRLFRP